MSLVKILNANDAEVSNSERIAMGLDLRIVVVSDIAENPSLQNESKTLWRDAHVEHSLIACENNQSKLKIK